MGCPCVQIERNDPDRAKPGTHQRPDHTQHQSVGSQIARRQLPPSPDVGPPQERVEVDLVVSRLSACQSDEALREPCDFFWRRRRGEGQWSSDAGLRVFQIVHLQLYQRRARPQNERDEQVFVGRRRFSVRLPREPQNFPHRHGRNASQNGVSLPGYCDLQPDSTENGRWASSAIDQVQQTVHCLVGRHSQSG